MKNQKTKNNEGFFNRVYDIARQIPYGRITSYGAIANYLGTAQSARVVGWAMNNSHHQNEYVPAHRVVNRNGLLTGKHHFGNSNTMKQLLENESIKIENDKIIDFEKHFWDPVKEL
ncbi:MAG: MGMT family protein [Bacteroidales bacterium]|nr:MGMT family protein [Bacteroidales bacterium]